MRHTATATRCPDCRQLVIAAISTDAINTCCDPVPLTRQGEFAANLIGRRTYRLDTDRYLWATVAARILTEPMPGDLILVAHACGRPAPATWTQPLPDPEPGQDYTAEAPF